jgi:hypothetical protein
LRSRSSAEPTEPTEATLRSRSNTEITLRSRSRAEATKAAEVSARPNQAGTTKATSGSGVGYHARAAEASGTEIHSSAKALCKGVDGHDSCNCEDDESCNFLHSRSP